MTINFKTWLLVNVQCTYLKKHSMMFWFHYIISLYTILEAALT